MFLLYLCHLLALQSIESTLGQLSPQTDLPILLIGCFEDIFVAKNSYAQRILLRLRMSSWTISAFPERPISLESLRNNKKNWAYHGLDLAMFKLQCLVFALHGTWMQDFGRQVDHLRWCLQLMLFSSKVNASLSVWTIANCESWSCMLRCAWESP